MSAELHLRDDAGGATPGYFSGLLDTIEVVDPHTITFHMKGSTLLMPDKMSRGFGGGEVLILSKKQIDQEGLEGIDQKPAGTGPYEYGGRTVGQSIWFERIEGEHWRGERPDFKEIEIRWMREEATRLAALLVGEIHIASLSRELQFEAIQQGMKNIGAQVPTNYLVLFLSGQYYSAGDPAYDPSLPWANPQTGKLVRQAMNKAINRDELLQFVLRGSGKPMYNTAFHPSLEGWNPKWVEDWEELYGYDPDKATELMREAGYGPENPMDFTIWNYVSSDEPETRVLVEALINYWEPIGINLKLVDTEWGTVQAAYRAKDDMIKQGGWGNVITMRSVVERIASWSYPEGTSRNWETDLINENWQKISQTTDPKVIDQLVREVGDERCYNFADIPFFWFDLEVTVNPEIIESWTYPGTTASKTSQWNLLKAAK
jgi:peptide/nickel transport system substrate-binding protein